MFTVSNMQLISTIFWCCADFIHREIRKVVEKIGPKLVVQIVTDNGSNYKKACEKLIEEYKHIFWQPCAAHTINLMLKDIGKFRKVANVVASAKLICRFLYNHNRLHDEMKKKIGGELIRPNATRFGTVFMFLKVSLTRKNISELGWFHKIGRTVTGRMMSTMSTLKRA